MFRCASCANRRMKSGFTLIELLAVMVVIGILATLGFPAWHSIHERTLDAKCKNNLRELASAAILYADDHRGRFPIAYDKNFNCWDFAVYHGDIVLGELWEYTTSKDILACPKCYGVPDNCFGAQQTGYNYNTSAVGGGAFETRKSSSRMQNFENLSRLALFGDAGYGDPEVMNKFMRAPKRNEMDDSGASTRKAGTQSFRHLRHTNVSFADGHVESICTSFKMNGKKGFVAGHTGFLPQDLYFGKN